MAVWATSITKDAETSEPGRESTTGAPHWVKAF